MGRQVANDAMDVHGGKAIMLGPKNYLARGYESIPIAVTVEGANILTRNLIIFGQGVIRCHPFVLPELTAAQDEDRDRGLIAFDSLLMRHIGYAISNAMRSLVMGLTLSRFTDVPASGFARRYYQRVNRYSASYALAADVAMLTLGGSLKRRELLSARLGDILSYLYLTSMVLKDYENQGSPSADRPLVEWACRTLLYRTQEQLHSFLRNFPNRWVARCLRLLIFPRGRMFSSPSDELGQEIVELIINPTPTRERLCDHIYKTVEPGNPLGLLQEALEAADKIRRLERKVFDAGRDGKLKREDTPGMIDEAERLGIISAPEAEQIREFDRKTLALLAVDDFAPEELARHAPRQPRPASKKKRAAPRRKKTASAGTVKSTGESPAPPSD
jgi:acyl-CoA dehydrogenase